MSAEQAFARRYLDRAARSDEGTEPREPVGIGVLEQLRDGQGGVDELVQWVRHNEFEDEPRLVLPPGVSNRTIRERTAAWEAFGEEPYKNSWREFYLAAARLLDREDLRRAAKARAQFTAEHPTVEPEPQTEEEFDALLAAWRQKYLPDGSSEDAPNPEDQPAACSQVTAAPAFDWHRIADGMEQSARERRNTPPRPTLVPTKAGSYTIWRSHSVPEIALSDENARHLRDSGTTPQPASRGRHADVLDQFERGELDTFDLLEYIEACHFDDEPFLLLPAGPSEESRTRRYEAWAEFGYQAYPGTWREFYDAARQRLHRWDLGDIVDARFRLAQDDLLPSPPVAQTEEEFDRLLAAWKEKYLPSARTL